MPTLPLLRWVSGCAVAEAIGMTAAATSALAATRLVEGSDLAAVVFVAALVVVAGGLVEGVALGTVQGRLLAVRWPALHRRRFLVVTVLVAGLGWAAGSAPVVVSGEGGGTAPAAGWVLLGAAGLGLPMGVLLGAAQAWVLRGAVERPGRWVLANALAWPPAMVVIFGGATLAGAEWPALSVVLLGSATGAAAGAVLGVVTGAFLPSLAGPPHAAPGDCRRDAAHFSP